MVNAGKEFLYFVDTVVDEVEEELAPFFRDIHEHPAIISLLDVRLIGIKYLRRKCEPRKKLYAKNKLILEIVTIVFSYNYPATPQSQSIASSLSSSL